MTAEPRLMTREQRDLIVNLHIADQQTGGRPELRPEEVPIARGWLHELLPDADKLAEHTALLADLYRTAFQPPPSRRDRWEGEPHVRPRPAAFIRWELSEERAAAVAENGPAALGRDAEGRDELACLLLSPFDLWELSDCIRMSLSDWWIDALAAAGRDIIRRHDLVITLPDLEPSDRKSKRLVRTRGAAPRGEGQEPPQARGHSVPLRFTEDSLPLRRQIAERLYGDPNREFELVLYRRESVGEKLAIAELKVSPAPVKDEVTLTVDIKGHARSFTLSVPPSVRLDPEADVPESVFARANEPVPEEAFDLAGIAEGRPGWPAHVVLRCRNPVALARR